jgi:predicted membrane-bound spermidine synthase
MSGMAIGAYLGGWLMARSHKSGLLLYAQCQLVLGIYCIATPALFLLAGFLYVALAEGSTPGAPWLVGLQFAFSAAILFIPTSLMGMTLPLMVSELKRQGHGIGGAISKLYGANMLGAASGAVLSAYLILPVLGVGRFTALGAIGSLLVALSAFKLNKAIEQKNPLANSTEFLAANSKPTAISVQPAVIRAGLIAFLLVGCATLMLGINYMQLLTAVAGNSVYAFSLMLFTSLLGLGAGAIVAGYVLNKGVPNALLFSMLLIGLATVSLLGLFQWDQLPLMFGAYEAYPLPLGFGERETIRAIACWSMLFPLGLLIGACYPVALELVTEANQQTQQCRKLGTAIGLNTLGNIVGCLVGGFVLLPLLGTQKTILLAAAICLFAGLMVALADKRLKNLWVIALSLITVTLFALQPKSFNTTLLASGANLHFQFRNYGMVIDHADSLDGGLTAVAASQSNETGELKTLLTNGQFQGNNSLPGDMKTQLSFATTPLLQTLERTRALVIGYGSGVSARAIAEAGFKQVDIVESSRDLMKLSNEHFSAVNARISEQAGVTPYLADGRNYLLLQNKRYDLISIELTTTWFAGGSPLYNQEFYELAAKRLTDRGVLQQWVPLHNVYQTDIASILSTVRAVFPDVRLYTVGAQGIIIATKNAQNVSLANAIGLMEAQPGLMSMFNQVGISPNDIAGNLMLSPEDVTRLVKLYATSSDFAISTDDNSFLAYSTPKGNTLDGQASLDKIKIFLKRFSNSANRP